MKALLLKDLISLKTYGRSVIIIVAAFTVASFFSGDSDFIASYMSLLLAVIAVTSISYDEQAKWNLYALSMPISRKQLVLGKYILAFILTCLGACISLFLALIPVWRGYERDILQLLLTIFTSASFALLMLSLLLPLVYKYGVEKSRVLLFIIVLIPSILVVLWVQTGIFMPEQVTEQVFIQLFKMLPVVALLLYAVSYFVSAAIFSKKDI